MSKALLCLGRYCVRGASVLLRLCGGGLWLNDYVGALVSGLLFWGACVVGAIMSVVLFFGGCYCCSGTIVERRVGVEEFVSVVGASGGREESRCR